MFVFIYVCVNMYRCMYIYMYIHEEGMENRKCALSDAFHFISFHCFVQPIKYNIIGAYYMHTYTHILCEGISEIFVLYGLFIYCLLSMQRFPLKSLCLIFINLLQKCSDVVLPSMTVVAFLQLTNYKQKCGLRNLHILHM